MKAMERLAPLAERAERRYLHWREAHRQPAPEEAPEGRADFFLLGLITGLAFAVEVVGHINRARQLDVREGRAQLVLVSPGHSIEQEVTHAYAPPWHDAAAAGDVEPVEAVPLRSDWGPDNPIVFAGDSPDDEPEAG